MQATLKSIFVLICIALLMVVDIEVTLSQSVGRGHFHNDAHPGKCAITEDFILSPGESGRHPNECSKVTCDNEDGFATIYGCFAIGALENCEWGEVIDAAAPYPECCARHLICRNAENATIAMNYENRIIEMLRNSAQNEAINQIIGERTGQLHKEL